MSLYVMNVTGQQTKRKLASEEMRKFQGNNSQTAASAGINAIVAFILAL